MALAGATPAAAAVTIQTASCTDAGSHLWKVKTTWGGTYRDDDGTIRRGNDGLSFTSAASDATTVDYTVATYDGSGALVKRYAKSDLAFDFDGGERYYTMDPRNPPTSPGKAKVVLSIGDGDDGKGNCTVSFIEPGRAVSAPAPATGAACDPGDEVVKFNGQGSAGLGQYGQGDYDASAELWGVGGYNYVQTMGVCTHDSWYVDVKTDNSKGDGAVKAYPSMRRIYHDWSTSDFSKDPLVSSFPRLDVSFAATDPTSCSGCIYNTAFDVWLNGIGDGDANELMIWTHNVNQRPYGDKVASDVKIAGHTWDLWTGNSNHYIAFVPTDTSHIPAGTFDIKDFTSYLADHGKIASSSRLGQISFGVETVSTDDVTRRWNFTKFSISDS